MVSLRALQVSADATVPLLSRNWLTFVHGVIVTWPACYYPGSAADGLSLIDRLESKLEEHPGKSEHACMQLRREAALWSAFNNG